MPIVEVKVPQLSESVSEATLATWHKKEGDSVIGGTVNHSSVFIMKASLVGSNSSLAQIVKLVQRMSLTRPVRLTVCLSDRVHSFPSLISFSIPSL